MKSVGIALFSGINVGGNRIVKMEALRGLFADLGYADAATYVQSGNVVFASRESPAKAAARIESAFEKEFGFHSVVVTRPAAEWQAMIDANPFTAEADDPTKVHVLVLANEPTGAAFAALEAEDTLGDAWARGEGVIYLHTPNGLGRSKFAARIGRLIKVHYTQRNWRTVLALRDLAEKVAEKG